MEDLVDKLICPHCHTPALPVTEQEYTEMQGSIKCTNCGTRYYFDTEVIVFYKIYKTAEEYIDKRLPICEYFRLMGADFDEEHM